MIKAIVDTCFLERFKNGTELSSDFSLLVDEAGFELLIHPYVFENEMKISTYVTKAVEQGRCKVVEYNTFIPSDVYKEYYRGLFVAIYNEFYDRLIAIDSLKADDMHRIDDNTDVYHSRYSKSSFGDVHMILMALFMKIPIILSQDSDMAVIYDIAKNKVNSKNYCLELYRVEDVISLISQKDNRSISGKELRRLRRAYD